MWKTDFIIVADCEASTECIFHSLGELMFTTMSQLGNIYILNLKLLMGGL